MEAFCHVFVVNCSLHMQCDAPKVFCCEFIFFSLANQVPSPLALPLSGFPHFDFKIPDLNLMELRPKFRLIIINSRFLSEVSPEMAMKNTIMLLYWVVLRRRNQCHHQQFIIMFCKPAFSSSAAHPFRSSASQPTNQLPSMINKLVNAPTQVHI